MALAEHTAGPERAPARHVHARKATPQPFAPQISARRSYALHKILDRNPVWERVAAVLERYRPAYAAFTATEDHSKETLYGCRMCGQCALPITGYACPMTCPKQLRNGPCGGVGENGACEVYPEQRCVWVIAYERAEANGHADDLMLLQRPVDRRKFGQSSWVNFWAGRDEYLADAPKAHRGLVRPVEPAE